MARRPIKYAWSIMIPEQIPVSHSQTLHAVGLVIYTYGELESVQDDILTWASRVEAWLSRRIDAFAFESRAKMSQRIWKYTPQNVITLHRRLQQERPWTNLLFGWGADSLRRTPRETGGGMLFIKSRPQPERGRERMRHPSFVYLELHPDLLAASNGGMQGLITHGIDLWSRIDGCYGFIDAEADWGVHSDLSRNILHFNDSTLPVAYQEEYLLWKQIDAILDRRMWRPFWGNFLGAPHLHALVPQVFVSSHQLNVYPLAGDGAYVGCPDSIAMWINTIDHPIRKLLATTFAPIMITPLGGP